MGFGALAMFSNVANAEMCRDFDDDMNVVEYECGTSLQKALEQQKQKKLEQEQKKKESFSEDDFFAEFDKKSSAKKSGTRGQSGSNKNTELQKYFGGNLLYAPSVKLDSDYGSVSIGNGYGITAAVGIARDQLRGDIEFKYMTGMKFHGIYEEYFGYTSKVSEETVKFSNINLMLNGYCDIITFGAITPFVGGGLGFTHVSVRDDESYQFYDSYLNLVGGGNDSSTKTYFTYAWQIGAGVSIKVNKSIAVDFAYRYNGTGKIEEVNMFSHELLLGGRVMF